MARMRESQELGGSPSALVLATRSRDTDFLVETPAEWALTPRRPWVSQGKGIKTQQEEERFIVSEEQE